MVINFGAKKISETKLGTEAYKPIEGGGRLY